MSDVSIKLGDAEVKAAMEAAVLNALGPIGREAIIKHAVDYLTRAPSGSYASEQPSPLLQIVRTVAREIASATLKERMEKDEAFQAQVRQLYADATARLFNIETREKLVDKLAGKMADALTSDRY